MDDDLFSLTGNGSGLNHLQGLVLAGVDEVGRGPLAGDVVAAAVILDPKQPIDGLNDSKKLTEKRREYLAPIIRESALAWAIGRASVAEIDQLNILHASMLAMKRAVDALDPVPDYVLVDGNRLPQWQYASEPVVGGDARVAEIAAASILAKVQRDGEMVELDAQYPGYGLAQHKGYPTQVHLAALKSLGVTPEHRRSFAPVTAALAHMAEVAEVAEVSGPDSDTSATASYGQTGKGMKHV